jgi:hypothetical protein
MGQVQTPDTQEAPAAQEFPHWAQLSEFEPSATHEPLQLVVVGSHAELQAPFEQTSPGAQAVPHAPQFLGSASRSLQEPSQSVSLTRHVQVPLVQLSPAVHVVEQSPQ